MHKLPVFATAGLAYQFLLREAATILRLSWFVLLIVTIIQYFAMRAQFAGMRSAFESGKVNPLAMFSPTWQWQIANFCVAILGSAIVAVALHRVILLGDRKPGRFLYVAFGKVELLFALLPIILMGPFVIVAALIFGVFAALGLASVAAFPVILVWAGMLFVMVRLTPLFPITVLEGRYNFSQAWSLTRGHFWRIVGLWIVVLVPFAIVVGIIGSLTSPFGALGGGMPKNVADIFERFESMLLLQSVLGFIWSIIGGALGVAVLSYSYKALSGIDPDAVWTPEGGNGAA